jgi:CTP:molybdopterin cytidylyltransferase MocA
MGTKEIHSGPYVVNGIRAHPVAFPHSVLTYLTSVPGDLERGNGIEGFEAVEP